MSSSFLALALIKDPLMLFLSGVAMLVLFIWYFATESERRKRNIGTILTLGLCALCLLALSSKGALKGGIDLIGGSLFALKVQPNEDPDTGKVIPLRPDDLDQAVATIEKRLGNFGTDDMIIAKSGEDGIILQLPGMSPERSEEIEAGIRKVAKLEFREVEQEGFQRDTAGGPTLAERVLNGDEIRPGYEAISYEFENRDGVMEGETILLRKRTAIDGGDVVRAYPQIDGAEHMVGIELSPAGGEKMMNLTRPMTPGQDRIAVLLDGEVITAPVVQSVPLGRNFVIQGQKSQEEARTLSSQLLNPLKNELAIDQKTSISPTLGKAVVTQGVMASLIGITITACFILVYYRMAGFVALIALLVNTVFLFGAMAMFGFTFTLPGIAGIILTIGMAVDANVLIYERLREEIDNGKSLKHAINTAYDKAFSAIFDSNATSLIAAAILFWKASGTVQGFAVTLTIGILTSMFSAILVTRVIFRWANDLKLLKNLSFLNVFRKTKFDFLGKRRIAAMVSGALFLAAISGFFVRGDKGLGVDFTGGTLLQFQLGDKEITQPDAQRALDGLQLNAVPIIQEETIPGTGLLLSIRCDTRDAGIIEQQIRDSFEFLQERIPVLSAENVETGDTAYVFQVTTKTIGATAGSAFLLNSVIALGMGLVGILVYLTFRFEFPFALGAFVALVHDVVITTGLIVLFGGELSLIHVGAILTIAGYSINDTIIVFDRIRETLLTSSGSVKDLMNEAINATLSRTLLTSVTTIQTVAVLSIFGGDALADFSRMILVGLVIGTYSSIFVASPVVLWWSRGKGRNLRRDVLEANLAGQPDAAT